MKPLIANAQELKKSSPFQIHLIFTPTGLLKKATLSSKPSGFALTFSGPCPDLDLVQGWFTAYFQSHHFPFPLPLVSAKTPFTEKVLARLQNIPIGEKRTYREVALSLGNAHRARAVGNACRDNPFPLIIPCHRVVRSVRGSSGDQLGGFAYGCDLKKEMLAFEKTLIQRTY